MLLFIIGASYWSIRKCSISIHLMLLFIGSGLRIIRLRMQISIHLMLLFIRSSLKWLSVRSLFQYISCYCLSHRCLIPQILCSISIHLMLLFIWEKSCESVAFSHISIHLMLLFIVRLMNTITWNNWFQYISCYCLSCSLIQGFKDLVDCPFQYISCYCLSIYPLSRYLC